MAEILYDYIVVGGGTSGCVLAAGLSADPGVKVLLLEAGGRGRGPLFRIPKASMFVTESNQRYSYVYATEAAVPGGGADTWLRGRVLGGSSATNGMIYNRGWRDDWDAVPGWGWADILPAYREVEDHQLGATALRGAGGPLHVSVQPNGEPVNEAFIEAAGNRGLKRMDDVNTSDEERIGYTPATIKRGVRQSANLAFLREARLRPNLTVRTGATVTRVIVEKGRAVGVVVAQGSGSTEIRTGGEVILSLGNVETPKLLELSGIGDGVLLSGLGIDVVLDRPAVGSNVIEHRMISLSLRLNRRGLGYNEMLRRPTAMLQTLSAYAWRRGGFLAAPGAEVLGFLRTDSREPRIDAQIWMTPVSADLERRRPEKHPGTMILGQILRPASRGHLHIVSADPRVPPRITPNYLADPDDRRRTLALLARMRDIAAEQPLAGMVESETSPGDRVLDEQSIAAYAMTRGFSGYHAVGACAIGTGPESVVDPRLRVRGIDSLRVMDASVLPVLVAGNTNAPLIAMSALAARRILGDR